MKQKTALIADLRRRYYLDVMGIQQWMLKQPAVSAPPQVVSDPFMLLQQQVTDCDACDLSDRQFQRCAGVGNVAAKLMLILLAPAVSAEQSERTGEQRLMTVEAEQLLTKMLVAIEIDIKDVFVTSLLKCPLPPGHRITRTEVAACRHHLDQQLEITRPDTLFVMGETAAQCLLGVTDNIDVLREQQYTCSQRPVWVSYSADDLLCQPENKKKAWLDLQRLQQQL